MVIREPRPSQKWLEKGVKYGKIKLLAELSPYNPAALSAFSENMEQGFPIHIVKNKMFQIVDLKFGQEDVLL